jgi:hypothetical protein
MAAAQAQTIRQMLALRATHTAAAVMVTVVSDQLPFCSR